MGKLAAMVAPADIAPVSVGPVIAPTSGLAVATAATAPLPAAEAQAIAAQVTAEIATLTENLPVAAPPSALATMVGEAATQQVSLAPLLADLAVAVTSPSLPPAVQATAAQILASQAPLDANVTAGQLRAAAQGSGVFLETDLAAAVAQGQAPSPAAMQQDLKALLLQLAGELAPLLEGAPQPRAPVPSAQPRTAAALRVSEDQPEPPVAGGPTAGQPAARPSFAAEAPIATLARTLQQEVQGALARVQLSQAASVEKPGEPTRWMFEVPIATPDGTAIAQFELSRDGNGGSAATEPSWRARFSVNVAPSGPVHADVMLGKGRARVTLTAEDAAARQALAANLDELATALAEEQGPDVAVRVIGGAPPRPQQPAGQLVDRRS